MSVSQHAATWARANFWRKGDLPDGAAAPSRGVPGAWWDDKYYGRSSGLWRVRLSPRFVQCAIDNESEQDLSLTDRSSTDERLGCRPDARANLLRKRARACESVTAARRRVPRPNVQRHGRKLTTRPSAGPGHVSEARRHVGRLAASIDGDVRTLRRSRVDLARAPDPRRRIASHLEPLRDPARH